MLFLFVPGGIPSKNFTVTVARPPSPRKSTNEMSPQWLGTLFGCFTESTPPESGVHGNEASCGALADVSWSSFDAVSEFPFAPGTHAPSALTPRPAVLENGYGSSAVTVSVFWLPFDSSNVAAICALNGPI